MGEGNSVGCKEDDEKSQTSALITCVETEDRTVTFHRVAYCMW
jgi:hypothetical protein